MKFYRQPLVTFTEDMKILKKDKVMERIKRYSREDINNMKKQFLLQDRRFIDISDHKAVVETMQNKIEELEKENKKLNIEIVKNSIEYLLSLNKEELFLVKHHCQKEIKELFHILQQRGLNR